MPTSYTQKRKTTLADATETIKFRIPNGVDISVHVARYRKDEVRPRVVVFNKHEVLLKWCRINNITDAINGGFSLHHNEGLLGEAWTKGEKHKFSSFSEPWHITRGSAHISTSGRLRLAPRDHLPKVPRGDLLQAGPLLVHNRRSLVTPGQDIEGISIASHQLDDDWTTGHWPRSAIGVSRKYIWCLSTDGYGFQTTKGHYGLSLSELADIMIMIGASEALNLDGGSSTTLISEGRLINKARAGVTYNYEFYPEGRRIPSAIVFESR